MLSYTFILIKMCLLLGVSSYVFGALLKPEDRRWIHGKPLWLITLSFPVALILPNIWILLGLMVVVLPLLARDRGEAAALYLIALLALPAMQLPVMTGSISIIRLSTYNCLSISLLIASFSLSGGARTGRGRFDLAVVLLIGLNLIASARGLNATSTLRETAQVALSYALPYWAVCRSVTKPQDLGRLLLAFCFAGVVLSVIALYEAKTFWPIYEMLPVHYGMPPVLSQALKVRAGLMRGNATFPESTSFSWLLAICLVATIVLRNRFRSRACWYVALAITVGGLLATQARGGWIAAALGVVLVDIYWKRWGAAGTKLAAASTLYAGLWSLSHRNIMLSQTIGSSGDAALTVDYRQELLRRGMQEIARHPWTGTDLRTAMSHLEDLRQGEGIIDFVNAYVYYGIVAGILGMAALGLAFLYAASSSWTVGHERLAISDAANAGVICFAVSLFTAVSAFTSGFSGSPTTFFYIVLAGAAIATRLRTPKLNFKPSPQLLHKP